MTNLNNDDQNNLIAAIIKGQLKEVENIIDTLELPDPWLNGYKYLCFATEYHQDEIVEFLLRKNIPVNSSADKFHNSPLNWAVKSNKIYTVKILLEKKAELDKKNLYQQNSFDIALEHGNIEILELLVDQISDFNISVESYFKLLADLMSNSHHKLLEKLLKKCLNINICAISADSFLFTAVQKNYYSVVEILLSRGIEVNSINYSRYGSQTALYIACRIGDSKMADLLLRNGASMDIKYNFYYSNAPKNVDQYNLFPIHIAIVYGYHDVVQVLLNHGDDCNKKYLTPYGTEYSALYLACEYHREEIVKLLVEQNADVNFQDHRGYKPILAAVSAREYGSILNGNYNIFKYLIGNKNLKLDLVNMKVILAIAAQRLNIDILELAFENLKSLQYELYDLMKDRSNSLPHLAIQLNKSSLNIENFTRFVNVWIAQGFDVNCKDQNGKSLLHKAFWYRQISFVELLLGYGCEYSACDAGDTPLVFMRMNRRINERDFDGECENFVNYVTQYFVKMKLLNISVNDCDYEKLISENENPFKYQVEYEKEIDNMKQGIIADGITFYDFVTADINKMVVLLNNEIIFKTLKTESYGPEFPQYKNVIKGCFYKGLIRKKLLDEVDKYTVFNIIKKLPYPCMHAIMNCFSNSDLRDVINEYLCLINN